MCECICVCPQVVEKTVIAALGIDWPADKLHLYVLDDGGSAGDTHIFQVLVLEYNNNFT